MEKVRLWLSAQQRHPLFEAEESESEGEKSETSEDVVK